MISPRLEQMMRQGRNEQHARQSLALYYAKLALLVPNGNTLPPSDIRRAFAARCAPLDVPLLLRTAMDASIASAAATREAPRL